MAGSYPDVPSRRMAWDVDGTVCIYRRPWDSQDTGWTLAEKQEANDEDNTNIGTKEGKSATTNNWGSRFVWIFPELRDIDGIFLRNSQAAYINKVEWSADSTNGNDGTWTTIFAEYTQDSNSVYGDYRDHIDAVSITGARAFRFHDRVDQDQIRAVHLYGKISAGKTPDRLLFIDTATGLEFTLPIDYGDVPRGTVHDRTIRVKNNSLVMTATDITLSFEDLYLGSSSWYTIKETAGAFATTAAIDQLEPGVTYPTAPDLFTIRQTVPGDEQLGLHAARLKGNVTSWGLYATMKGTATVTASITNTP